MSKFEIDTDKIVNILKIDKPISFGVIDDSGKPKLLLIFALPELENKIKVFVEEILIQPNNGKR